MTDDIARLRVENRTLKAERDAEASVASFRATTKDDPAAGATLVAVMQERDAALAEVKRLQADLELARQNERYWHAEREKAVAECQAAISDGEQARHELARVRAEQPA